MSDVDYIVNSCYRHVKTPHISVLIMRESKSHASDQLGSAELAIPQRPALDSLEHWQENGRSLTPTMAALPIATQS